MRRAAGLALLGMVWAGMALAAVHSATAWRVAPGESRVLFDYQRNGKPAQGHFASFSGHGRFDPTAPADARLEIRIKSASIDLNDPTASAFATSVDWFDSANHPDVVYQLTRLTPEGGNRYRADGDLTIRDTTKPIETTLTLTVENGTAHAKGSLKLDRTQYWLGVGPTALFVDIGHQVSVNFDLIAHPVN